MQIVSVRELIERVEQNHDATFAGVVAEALPEPIAQAVEVALRFFAFLLLVSGPFDAAAIEFVQQADADATVVTVAPLPRQREGG